MIPPQALGSWKWYHLRPAWTSPRASTAAQSTAIVLVHAGLRRYHFHEPSPWVGIISQNWVNASKVWCFNCMPSPLPSLEIPATNIVLKWASLWMIVLKCFFHRNNVTNGMGNDPFVYFPAGCWLKRCTQPLQRFTSHLGTCILSANICQHI